MEVSFLDLRDREIINVYDGKKLGRIIDVVFNNTSGMVRGIVVPGNKKLFHRSDDIFIPLEKIKRIGNDVILVGVQQEDFYKREKFRNDINKNLKNYENLYNYYSSRKLNNELISRRNNSSNQKIYYNKKNDAEDNKKNSVSFVRLKPVKNNKYK